MFQRIMLRMHMFTPRPQYPVTAAALIAAGLLVALQPATADFGRRAALVGLGFAGGAALYHAAFGFAGSWKRFITERRARGIRAQLLLIALVLPVSHALFSAGLAAPWVVPVGPALILGAAMFGVGMQLAGGCGSGTLFTAGGGSTRMILALGAFVAGSLVGTAPGFTLSALPAGPSLWLPGTVGATGAVILGLCACGALALAVSRAEGRVHAAPEPPRASGGVLRGPWPVWAGAVALALVCIGTFLVLGRPWGITSAFALWGAKIGAAAGLPVAEWPYWSGGRAAQLGAPVLADPTSVMDFAIIAGATGAAGMAGRFAPKLTLSRRDVITALAGGLLMGWGARLSSGCNIGALLGGITSGSLHGWVWAASAYAGSALWLRGWARAPQKAPS